MIVRVVVVSVCSSVLVASCQPTVSIGRVDPVSTTTMGVTPSTGVDGGSSDTSTHGDETGTMSASASTGPGTSTGAPVDPCGALLGDTACAECISQSCCPQVQACFELPECPCFLECYVIMSDSAACSMACQVPGPQLPALFNNVLSCTARSCPTECFQG